MPDVPRPGLRVSAAVVIPERELTWRFSRSSGPGGQGVNTTDSRVELSWDLVGSEVLTTAQCERALERLGSRVVGGVVTVVSSEQRAQLRNRDTARLRLAQLVAEAIAPPAAPRRATKPTKGSQVRRIEGKKRRGSIKEGRRAPRGDG